MMKAFARIVPAVFLVCMIAISGVPGFAAASDPSGPAIYFDKQISVGNELAVSGVGFTPSMAITFWCGSDIVQTVPNPLVTNSSGAFTGLLLTGNLPDEICTITATDGKMVSQAPLAIVPHDHNGDPRTCAIDGRNSIDVQGCGCAFGAGNSADGFCGCKTGAGNIGRLSTCCGDSANKLGIFFCCVEGSNALDDCGISG